MADPLLSRPPTASDVPTAAKLARRGATPRVSMREPTQLISYLTDELRGRSEPLLILFGGEGNCHKTTLAQAMVAELGGTGHSAISIEVDAFAHARSERRRGRYSGYDPRAFNLPHFYDAIRQLRAYERTTLPFYDHESGTPCLSCAESKHQHTIAFEGNYILIVGAFIHLLPEDLVPSVSVYFCRRRNRLLPRIRRDVARRGYRPTEAIVNYIHLESDRRKYFLPYIDQYQLICELGWRHYFLRK